MEVQEDIIKGVPEIHSEELTQTLPIILKTSKEPLMLTIRDVQLDFSQLPDDINPSATLSSEDLQLLQNAIYQFEQPNNPPYPLVSKTSKAGIFQYDKDSIAKAIKLYKFIEAIKEGNEDKIKKWVSHNRIEKENLPNPINDNNSLRALKNSLKTDSPFPDRLRMACVQDILNRQQFLIILALLYSLYAQVENEIQDTSKTKEYKESLERIIKENLEKLRKGEQDEFPLVE